MTDWWSRYWICHINFKIRLINILKKREDGEFGQRTRVFKTQGHKLNF